MPLEEPLAPVFEISFAMNAILAVIMASYRAHRDALYDFVIDRVSTYLPAEHVPRLHIARFIYSSASAFRALRYGFGGCISLALAAAMSFVRTSR